MEERPIEPQDQLWEELVQSEAFDQEMVSAYQRMNSERPWRPLGKILMQLGHLNTQQLFGLLALQAEETGSRLGDLAIEEGLCTVEQVTEAIQLQREECPGPIELLLEDENISEMAVLRALVGYVHHLEGRLYSLTHTHAESLRAIEGDAS